MSGCGRMQREIEYAYAYMIGQRVFRSLPQPLRLSVVAGTISSVIRYVRGRKNLPAAEICSRPKANGLRRSMLNPWYMFTHVSANEPRTLSTALRAFFISSSAPFSLGLPALPPSASKSCLACSNNLVVAFQSASLLAFALASLSRCEVHLQSHATNFPLR